MTGFFLFVWLQPLNHISDWCYCGSFKLRPFTSVTALLVVLQFFQFCHETLKTLWFVGKKIPETDEETVIWYPDESSRRLARGCWLVFRHLEISLVHFVQTASRRRRSADVTTEGLKGTARQHHWTCAPSRTGGTGQTGQAGCCCSDRQYLCRWSRSLQQKAAGDVISRTFSLSNTKNINSLL